MCQTSAVYHGAQGGDVLRCRVILRRLALAVVLFAGVTACGPPRATLLTEVPDAEELGPEADRYALSSTNTEVEAEISAGPTFTLSFSDVEGTLHLDPRDPARTRVELTIDTSSAKCSIDRVAEIAMSDHFLDIATYPTASFATRVVEAVDDGHVAIAQLDLHGVERGLRTPITVAVEPCELRVDVGFSFDRHAFEMQTEGSLETLVSDTVAVIFRIRIPRPCAAG